MTVPAVRRGGDSHPPFRDVSSIAVLRGGGIGDLVMAMPAINALAETYPGAAVTLLGMPSHADILRSRKTCIARVEVLPFAEGIRTGSKPPDPADLARFVTLLRARSFDLAVQLHGGGRYSNPLINALQASHTVGSRTADSEPLERTVPHQYFQHEVLRGLEVAALAGASSSYRGFRWEATAREQLQAREALPGLGPDRPLIVIHPGARDPRRRWPAVRFGSVAASLAASGCQIVIVGDRDERDLVHAAAQRARHLLGSRDRHDTIVALAGTTDLGLLCGVLALSQALLANDSGPRHVAEALGVPTASIYWAPNLVNAGPLLREHHRVQIAWNTGCPVCKAEAAGHTAPGCGHKASFVDSIGVKAVVDDVHALLGA